MRGVVIDAKVSNVYRKIYSVNMRNSIIISNELNCKCWLDYRQVIEGAEEKFDFAIVGFGSLNSESKITQKVLQNTNKVFWLVTEYEQSTHPALFYSKKDYVVIQNFQGKGKISSSKIKARHELNLNLLISKQPNQIIPKKYDCVYYSRWRPDRQEYFKKYIQHGMYFSTDVRNRAKYKKAGCNPIWIEKLEWEDKKETLNLFRYSLYIEDKYTHGVFNNLANRWYESGFCNVVMFFDVNCKNTIEKSEIGQYFDPYYYVSSHGELMQKIQECNQDWVYHLNVQKAWRKDEPALRAKMIEDLKQIIGI